MSLRWDFFRRIMLQPLIRRLGDQKVRMLRKSRQLMPLNATRRDLVVKAIYKGRQCFVASKNKAEWLLVVDDRSNWKGGIGWQRVTELVDAMGCVEVAILFVLLINLIARLRRRRTAHFNEIKAVEGVNGTCQFELSFADVRLNSLTTWTWSMVWASPSVSDNPFGDVPLTLSGQYHRS